jgi:hypothetical protein
MSLTDFTNIGMEIFSPYILLWALLFVVVCILLAIFVGFIRLLMSRIE